MTSLFFYNPIAHSARIPHTMPTHCFFDSRSRKKITAASSVAKISPPFAIGKKIIFGIAPARYRLIILTNPIKTPEAAACPAALLFIEKVDGVFPSRQKSRFKRTVKKNEIFKNGISSV